MAGLLSKLTDFARSPKGQRAISTASRKAQQMARDPKNRSKIDGLRSKLGGRGGTGGGTTPR
ncbi:hypothetical protein [Quadrisphaera sp. INWT6]|uniref:hypothetical protein n=1 Tax=Quadrisphaera sp. INWT6 TaxID=2596917 RepID=UPI001892420C|nr:hypothetical protein [Quadrisphaera sp. INWT6]MBF5080729.1 hypothetical protein [Quadrisphaera sp. INWT6]